MFWVVNKNAFLLYAKKERQYIRTGLQIDGWTGSITYTHNRFTVLWILSRITRVSRYPQGKTNLDFTEARDSEWQWHQLGHM